MSFTSSVRHFQTLVISFHPIIAIETVEEERVETLIHAACKDLQMMVFEWSVAQGLMRSPGSPGNRWRNGSDGQRPTPIGKTTDPLDMLRHLDGITYRAIYWLKDFGRHLKDPVVARQFREVAHQFSFNRSTLVITEDSMRLPSPLNQEAVYFDLKLPSPDELYQTISQVMRNLGSRAQVDLGPDDIHALVQAMRGMTLKQARQVIAYAALADGKLTATDVERVVQRKAQVIHEGGLLDYLPAAANMAQLGGFQGLKAWLQRAWVGFSPEAHRYNLPAPKGILIVGVQGCGKSLAAKTVAREWKLPLLKLDAGRLYDKYIGESEKNFRRAVTMAETMAPVVLWIDEIEKSMGQTSGEGDGGLSRRLFGSFLTWLQEKSQDIFVVATANDLSQLPPELLRKGRFDEIFFVDLPDAHERLAILEIHLTRRNQAIAAFDLETLVQATEGFSGAEIEHVINAALYRALYEQRSLDTALLLHEITSTVPLSIARREDIQRLRAMAQERFVTVK